MPLPPAIVLARALCLSALALSLKAQVWAAPLRVATFNVEVGLGSPGSTSFEDSATVLQRIGADVVAMQELISDSLNLPAMGTRLGMLHSAYQSSAAMSVGLLSKYPLSPPVWISRSWMTRPILLVQVDVPGALRDPWIAVVHLKCCNDSGAEQYTRAVELYYLRKEIAQRVVPEDPVLIMGDFNLVAPDDVTYTTGPEGVSPFPAPASADRYFIPQGIFKMDARHAGTGGETWTWRSNGQFPNGALDHIMANAVVRARGTAVEIYNAEKDAVGIEGLPKQGSPLAASFAFVSDHLPVFADIDLEDGNPSPAILSVNSSLGLAAEAPPGGLFSPTTGTYVLSNTGSQSLEWAAQHEAPWLTLSPTGGTIAPGASVSVTASLNTAASSLAVGLHAAQLRFINRSNGLGTALASASVFVGSFLMDGAPDSPSYTVSAAGITLRVAVRGTRLYVATQSAGYGESTSKDHHILVSDILLSNAASPAPWAKRGLTALPEEGPVLAAEGANAYAGWFNAANPARLAKAQNSAGVLEGSIDLVTQFGTMPEFVYVAALAYETRDASTRDANAGRILSQVPLAVLLDDDITPDEFLKIPVRSITDSAADGRFDILVPGRGFAARVVPGSAGQGPELRWPALPGRDYTVLRKSNPTSEVWEPVQSFKAGANTWELSMPDNYGVDRGFYKVVTTEPGF
jgi:endonuclease/exonuclease/phosphatase family metal-dependent hydrolase